MNTLRKLIQNATFRLAARAVVAGATVIATAYLHTGSVTRAIVVGAALAAVEVFTPLNSLVGLFKDLAKPAPAT
jgi:hypothetical protein